MQRQTIDSTTIQSVGYDPETETLEIEFQNGRLYRYTGVPEAVYTGLMNAESPGKYFNGEIRDVYPATKVA